ncbi:MCE family protein [Aeromicrobium phragmitis]|uniref:MCE family protein n=1 Tax=Aeromicrobium phragmitis TaxID=2478914 RepID=A0A3L8PLY2_9ACTN|nr:MCE family protein [Aeromicrobium phragmitis]RLV55022.1 MCE family protein [Aeromicrobium phragmitis]
MRRLRLAVAGAAAALTLSGCGMLGGSVYDAPLPGGADVGSDPLRFSADFEDVLDLVPQSSVKLDNVDVGRVQDIDLNEDGESARVELVVNRDVELPAGTTARIQQTSLLGEKYVALVRPSTPQSGRPVGDGAHIGLAETSQAAQVEQVLGALSMVLNGGGIEQFQEISRELQQVSEGRPEEITAFLRQMESFVGVLDERKEAITNALDSLNELSQTLEADTDRIVRALDGLSPGMQVLVDQRSQLVAMLEALDRLSVVTVDTLNNAQDDIVADFQALEPILDQLARAGSALPESLQILLTYPFPDSVLGAIKGDYMNVFITTNFRTLPAGCAAKGCEWPQVNSTGSPSTGMSLQGRQGADPDAPEPELPPTLLPPTNSAVPGLPAPTIEVPPSRLPGAPSGTPSQPSPSPSTSSSPSSPPATLPEGGR